MSRDSVRGTVPELVRIITDYANPWQIQQHSEARFLRALKKVEINNNKPSTAARQ
jgi:hypothetical protein